MNEAKNGFVFNQVDQQLKWNGEENPLPISTLAKHVWKMQIYARSTRITNAPSTEFNSKD